MVDRVPASITIGGTLSVPEYWEFCQVVSVEGLSIEWDGDFFAPHHRVIGQALRLYAYEVPYGRFNDLETWCMAFRLPFVRWSGSCPGQWGAQRCIFRGEGGISTYPADDDDYVVLGKAKAEALGSYETIRAYFNEAEWTVPALVVTGERGDV